MTSARCCPVPLFPAKLLLSAALTFLAFFGAAQGPAAEPLPVVCAEPAGASAEPLAGASVAIQVTVENIRNSKGLITAVLYADDPENFLKKGARLDRIRVEAREGETALCLRAPSTGRFSVALYHDENGNKEFDRDFLGIPTEGYGFSQNPGFRFGKPKLEETLFTVGDGPNSLKISVLYLQG